MRGEFRTTFRTVLALVAQWIEQRFPKPQVACSIHAEGTEVQGRGELSVTPIMGEIGGKVFR